MKSQAETAARIFHTAPKVLERGSFVPDFELLFPDGNRKLLSQFRGRSNLVILFVAKNEDVRALLADLAGHASTLKNNESKVLVIGAAEHLTAGVQSAFATAAALQPPVMLAGARVIITDRFGEIFAAFPNTNSPDIPAADEVIRWLEFINQQCEECSPP